MGRRADQREHTRLRLLEAARAAFEERGFDGTHLRDVARAAGVASGTVFVHFADKRDLLHAALFDDLEAAIDGALDSGPAGLEPWLDHVAGALFGHYAARPRLSRVLLRESLLAEPPWAERFTGQVARVHAAVVARYLAERAESAVAVVSDRTEADAALFGVAFASFYTFALLSWVQGAHPQPRELVARLVRQHLAGAPR
jgi:AcrR family transcriptional regulator